jgi:hypothetical protein
MKNKKFALLNLSSTEKLSRASQKSLLGGSGYGNVSQYHVACCKNGVIVGSVDVSSGAAACATSAARCQSYFGGYQCSNNSTYC